MSYRFTPCDVFRFILKEDLPISSQYKMIHDLFQNHCSEIAEEYQQDIRSFQNEVNNLLAVFELFSNEIEEINRILNEVNGSSLDINQNGDNPFASYFKLVKLQLLYSGRKYVKMKVRTLLRDFGYKRRTYKLLAQIKEALKAMGISTFLRGHEPCDLRLIKVDDTIILRIINS